MELRAAARFARGAAKQILNAAHQNHADRIVLGTRSRSKLSKLLLGSVAEQVLRSVNLPVITVGPEARLPVESNTDVAVALHATTLGETSRPSAALACQIASILGARLILLHVLPHTNEMESKGLPTGLDSAAMKELQSIASTTAHRAQSVLKLTFRMATQPLKIWPKPSSAAPAPDRDGITARSGFQNLTRDRTVIARELAASTADSSASLRSMASTTDPPGVGRCSPAFQSADTQRTGHGETRTNWSAIVPRAMGPAPWFPRVPRTTRPAFYGRITSSSICTTAPWRTSEWLWIPH